MVARYYEITELLDLLREEQRRRRWRYRCFVWFLGLTYISFGFFGWRQLAGAWPVGWQVGGFLIALLFWPVLLAVFGGCNRWLGQWPRCPECYGKLENYHPASRRCPECDGIIVNDSRPLSKGYILPELPSLVPQRPAPGKTSPGNGAIQLIFIACIFLPAMIVIIPLRDCQNATMLELTAWSLVVTGCYVIIISDFMQLLFLPLANLALWIDQKCQKTKAAVSLQLCPECQCEPDHRIAALTGFCSHCGVKLVELADTPDTPEMMDFGLLHRYAKLTGLGVQYYMFVLIPMSFVFLAVHRIFQTYRWFWLITALIFAGIPLLWRLVVLPSLRKRWQLNFKCPVCHYNHSASNHRRNWQLLRQFGRCVNCMSKLVRDGDRQKADDKKIT